MSSQTDTHTRKQTHASTDTHTHTHTHTGTHTHTHTDKLNTVILRTKSRTHTHTDTQPQTHTDTLSHQLPLDFMCLSDRSKDECLSDRPKQIALEHWKLLQYETSVDRPLCSDLGSHCASIEPTEVENKAMCVCLEHKCLSTAMESLSIVTPSNVKYDEVVCVCVSLWFYSYYKQWFNSIHTHIHTHTHTHTYTHRIDN
eukprot:GHVR01030660.1.p1 GENE.GHVR01030660.1~~GHVR01030660.1.p1  ORF type:complete len:216 (+),score=146.37 GHVR01030660.1:52-648(+)